MFYKHEFKQHKMSIPCLLVGVAAPLSSNWLLLLRNILRFISLYSNVESKSLLNRDVCEIIWYIQL